MLARMVVAPAPPAQSIKSTGGGVDRFLFILEELSVNFKATKQDKDERTLISLVVLLHELLTK